MLMQWYYYCVSSHDADAVIHMTRFPSGKCLGEWRKHTFLSLPDTSTICCYFTYKKLKKLPGKIIEIAFYPQYFVGVLNSSNIFSTFWVLDIDLPTTDLLLRK